VLATQFNPCPGSLEVKKLHESDLGCGAVVGGVEIEMMLIIGLLMMNACHVGRVSKHKHAPWEILDIP
jgi:hypothetical protein